MLASFAVAQLRVADLFYAHIQPVYGLRKRKSRKILTPIRIPYYSGCVSNLPNNVTEGVTHEEAEVLMIRGYLASLPNEQKLKINAAYDKIVALDGEFGEDVARMAIALRGAELAAK